MKKLYYYLGTLVGLIVLATIIQTPFIQLLLQFLILVLLVNLFVSNLLKSSVIALVFVGLTYLIRSSNSGYLNQEGFENKSNDEVKKEINLMDEIEKLSKLEKENQSKLNEVNTEDDDDNMENNQDNIMKSESFNQITESDMFDDEEEKENRLPKEGDKYMEATKAQKDTFRLINTIKQLDDTMKTLAPTLQEGAKIIEKFKKLNLA